MKKIERGFLSIILGIIILLGMPMYGKASENTINNNDEYIDNNVITESVSNSDEEAIVETDERLLEDTELENVDIINNLIDYINNGEFLKIASIYQKDKSSDISKFLSEEENKNNCEGIFNVISARLIECVNIKYEDAKNMLYEEYYETPDVCVIGLDMNVHEDTRYFYNGINYFLITFVKEDGNPKIVEMISISEPGELINKGYKFSDNFSVAINVMNARKDGKFINGYGRTFDSLNGNMYSLYAVKNTRDVPTDDTIVRYKNTKGKIDKIRFHSYCIGVLAGEVRGKEFDGTVRQAQAIAIKTFTWHFLIVPKGPTEGYDVTYALQSYQPTLVSENKIVTTDYNTVKGVWMESYKGAIFEASYKKGKYQDQTTLKNCGEFKQDGARWLKDNKVATTYKALLKYYYDDSSASTGGAIRFFDGNKNEL